MNAPHRHRSPAGTDARLRPTAIHERELLAALELSFDVLTAQALVRELVPASRAPLGERATRFAPDELAPLLQAIHGLTHARQTVSYLRRRGVRDEPHRAPSEARLESAEGTPSARRERATRPRSDGAGSDSRRPMRRPRLMRGWNREAVRRRQLESAAVAIAQRTAAHPTEAEAPERVSEASSAELADEFAGGWWLEDREPPQTIAGPTASHRSRAPARSLEQQRAAIRRRRFGVLALALLMLGFWIWRTPSYPDLTEPVTDADRSARAAWEETRVAGPLLAPAGGAPSYDHAINRLVAVLRTDDAAQLRSTGWIAEVDAAGSAMAPVAAPELELEAAVLRALALIPDDADSLALLSVLERRDARYDPALDRVVTIGPLDERSRAQMPVGALVEMLQLRHLGLTDPARGHLLPDDRDRALSALLRADAFTTYADVLLGPGFTAVHPEARARLERGAADSDAGRGALPDHLARAAGLGERAALAVVLGNLRSAPPERRRSGLYDQPPPSTAALLHELSDSPARQPSRLGDDAAGALQRTLGAWFIDDWTGHPLGTSWRADSLVARREADTLQLQHESTWASERDAEVALAALQDVLAQSHLDDVTVVRAGRTVHWSGARPLSSTPPAR